MLAAVPLAPPVGEAWTAMAAPAVALSCRTNPMAVTAELFAGRVRMAGGAIVSPRLIEFVARKAADNSDILKQQRKALEVRGLAAPKAAGKK